MALDRSILRMNLANSLFYQEKHAEAAAQYAQAIEEMRTCGAGRDLGQALMLLAYARLKLGEPEAALEALREGIDRFGAAAGEQTQIDELLDDIHFHAKAAELYDELAEPSQALQHADAALQALGKTVCRQDADRYWESLLGQWQRLPGRKVRNELAVRNSGFARRALIAAEAAKGRLLYRQMESDAKAGKFDAMDEARQAEALERVDAWRSQPGKTRCMVSLFADHGGLAIFVLDHAGTIEASCEARFAYLQWLKRRMNPWDDAIQRYDPHQIAALEQGVLGELGSALWRTCPAIAQGGDELILLPHKALRNLPLQHAVLPTGQRLSEIFDRVYIYPTMWDFAECLGNSAPQPSIRNICGCVDPDGSLPFARLEGWLCCGHDRLVAGSQATPAAIERLSRNSEALLLSCHGSFDMENPWQSALHLANQDLRVADMADRRRLPGIVVLGACESGMSRRSASDEPVSFAGVLLRRGVKAVVAPLWPVDDCSSALFMTHLFKELRRGCGVSESVNAASAALRHMNASEALGRFNQWSERIKQAPDDGVLDKNRILALLSPTQKWLDSLAGDDRPWSMLDWGAYQLVGGYADEPCSEIMEETTNART